MIHIKYCRKCKEAFDIATNYDYCHECRGVPIKKIDREKKIWEQKLKNL